MTWNELSDLLTTAWPGVRPQGSPGRAIGRARNRCDAHCSGSMVRRHEASPSALNVGVYEGDEHRLVGTEQIPLAELTPEFVRERVEAACGERVQADARPGNRARGHADHRRATSTGRGPRAFPGCGPRAGVRRFVRLGFSRSCVLI